MSLSFPAAKSARENNVFSALSCVYVKFPIHYADLLFSVRRLPAGRQGFSIDMTRSLKKGPYVDEKLMKKVSLRKATQGSIKTWARASQIAPEFVGYTFAVHTGKNFDDVFVTEDMVGHRLGEFAPTTKFIKHGGKMQKESEMAAKAAEIAAATAAKATAATAGAKK